MTDFLFVQVFNSSDATWLEILPAQRPPGRYQYAMKTIEISIYIVPSTPLFFGF